MGNFVLAYGYDRVTHQYTGTVNAWEDQLTPGEYLLPANATFEPPPDFEQGKIRTFVNGSWQLVDVPTVTEPTPTPPTSEELATTNRKKRNDLLSSTDWTQLPDLPAQRLALASSWATYRQALRDVPQQVNFPNTINWPTPPGG